MRPGIDVYVDDLLPHAPLEQCSYWGFGQVFHTYSSNDGHKQLEQGLDE